ncbi:hypothetical protein pb186bvf_010603 [Paramecium bursaria]
MHQKNLKFPTESLIICKLLLKLIQYNYYARNWHTTKLSDFILQIQECQPAQYSYILIDAPSIPQREVFEKLAMQANLHLGFIFICNDQPIGLTFVIQPMDLEGQKIIIVNNLLYKSKTLPNLYMEQSQLKNIFEDIAGRVVSTFQVLTNNLTQLITIAWDMFVHFKYPSILLKDDRDFGVDFIIASRLLFQNPNIQIQSYAFKRQFEIDSQGASKNFQGQKQYVDTINATQTLEDVSIRLPKVAGLLVLSCYLSQRNSDKTDRIMFKDSRKSKRVKTKDFTLIKQKTQFERIKCIFQSLISLTTYEELDIEKNAFDQTTRFYHQLNLLVDKGFLKIIDHNNLKVECLITEKQAFQLAIYVFIKVIIMNIPNIFNSFTDIHRYEQFIADLVADCVHGIKLPYIAQYPEITNYSQVVECQQFMQYFSEALLELNNQNSQEVQKLLDKLKAQMDDDKHEIFARIMRENYRGMTKSALYHVIGLSKYVLIDFNWNLNLVVQSDKFSQSQLPTTLVELTLQTLDSNATKRKILFELNKEELDQFIMKLQKLQDQIQI